MNSKSCKFVLSPNVWEICIPAVSRWLSYDRQNRAVVLCICGHCGNFLLTSSPLMLPTIAMTSLSEISLHSKSKSRIEMFDHVTLAFSIKGLSTLRALSLGYLWSMLLVAQCYELLNLLHRAKPDRRKKTWRRGRSGSLKASWTINRYAQRWVSWVVGRRSFLHISTPEIWWSSVLSEPMWRPSQISMLKKSDQTKEKLNHFHPCVRHS